MKAAEIYCNRMEDIKRRIAIVRAVDSGQLTLGRKDFDAELICIHLRKVLEQIAFASLVAHKPSYEKVYRDFAKEWNAKKLLKKLRKVNPDFFPKPASVSEPEDQGVRNLAIIEDGYLTEDEFVLLYNICGNALHTKNPFNPGPHIVDFQRPVTEWVERIQKLLSIHWMRLTHTGEVWIVQMNTAEDGKVHIAHAQPLQNEQ